MKFYSCLLPNKIGFMLQVIHDLNNLVEEVCGDYLAYVLGFLKSCSPEVLDLLKQSILQGSNSLKVLQPLVINSIVEALVEKSVEVSNIFNFIFNIVEYDPNKFKNGILLAIKCHKAYSWVFPVEWVFLGNIHGTC